MTNRQQSILVVDDDSFFRELIAQIFRANGYEVYEARSAKEGLSGLSHDIGLAIVDYRLPDSDGVTFISRLREAGKNYPVVFISGTFCDAKTFSWLRNILKVALVLQKPIQPLLLLQQLEGLLPKRVLAEPEPVLEAIPERSLLRITDQHNTYERMIIAAASAQDAQDAEHAEQVRIEELKVQAEELRKKVAAENRVRLVQHELCKGIPDEWKMLSEAVTLLQANESEAELRKQATDIAHRLRGSAGSLGLQSVGSHAGKIEDYLNMLDVSNYTEHELLWTEIFRSLAEGETDLRAVKTFDKGKSRKASPEVPTAGSVLILGEEPALKSTLLQLAPEFDARFSFATSPTDVIMKSMSYRFDSVVIDLSMCSKSQLAQVTKEVRFTPRNADASFACIAGGNESLDAMDFAYIGITSLLRAPLEKDEFEQALKLLARTRQNQQPRILTVDDDKVLTNFIQIILNSNRMTVKALNEPISILEVLEEFDPDLILLDVMMPGLSGYDVCRMLREHEKWQSLPIIFLTSKSDAQGRAAAFQAGGNDFLSKPILSEELIARVEAHLDRARSQRQSASEDEVSGELNQRGFNTQMQDLLATAQTYDESLCLSCISIDSFADIEGKGLSAPIDVAATLGKMLRARFKSSDLRGRLEQGIFAWGCPGVPVADVRQALEFFVKEVEQLSFTGDLGKRFEIALTTSTASFPEDCSNVADLVDTAKRRLTVGNKKGQGAPLFS